MQKRLDYYGGNGYEGVKEDGIFEVHGENHQKEFYKLSEAREYYDSLNEGKALWDHTHIHGLLECHQVIEGTVTIDNDEDLPFG